MIRFRGKWKALALLGSGVLTVCGLFVALAWPAEEIISGRKFLPARRPLVIAHRGGAGLWPENTMYAFERAAAVGVDVLEIDVRGAADGELVLMHDATVGRTTNGGNRRVNELSLSQLKELDAGYRWSPDSGQTFPLRGGGIAVPTLREVFDAFPDMRFNIEPKQEQPSIVAPLCRLIKEAGMTDKVMVGAFSTGVLEEFRRECPEVATSASPAEASKFLAFSKVGLDAASGSVMRALQVPETAGGLQVLSRNFVAAAHAQNLEVHAWTINETEDMRRLLDMGVDGIMTDYPDRLLSLLAILPTS